MLRYQNTGNTGRWIAEVPVAIVAASIAGNILA